MAIETRKDQIERLSWRVRSKDEKKPQRGAEGRIAKAQALLRKPRRRHDFATWLQACSKTCSCWTRPPSSAGAPGGELIGLDYRPGDTIRVLVDDTGRRPRAPLDAYQQVIKGRSGTT
jgi:hypothetical protein